MTPATTLRGAKTTWLPTLCAVVVATVFARSAFLKFHDLSAFAASIGAYKATGPLAAKLLAGFLPVLEIAIAGALLVPKARRVAAFIATGMLTLFISAIVVAKARGLGIPCGCFGTESSEIGTHFWRILLEDVGLMACSIGAIGNIRAFFAARAEWAPLFVGITWTSAALSLLLSPFVAAPQSASTKFVIAASKAAGQMKPKAGKKDLRPEEIRRALAASLGMPPPPAISIEEARTKYSKALWIDARPAELYAKGHLAGAVSATPLTIASLISRLRNEHAMLRPLVVYCAPDCHNAMIVGNTLLQVGFQSVTVIDGGWNGIASANTQ
jgi:rhodanese-related sulfurtransferase/uncharacterized membrane protein YphA (DoxX/SURF4 family)